MKKLLILCSALLCTAFSAHAASNTIDDHTRTVLRTPVKLPDEVTLTNLINEVMQCNFAGETNLAKDLANSELLPKQVVYNANIAITTFLAKRGSPTPLVLSTALVQPDLIRGILKDHPEAICALVAAGVIIE